MFLACSRVAAASPLPPAGVGPLHASTVSRCARAPQMRFGKKNGAKRRRGGGRRACRRRAALWYGPLSHAPTRPATPLPHTHAQGQGTDAARGLGCAASGGRGGGRQSGSSGWSTKSACRPSTRPARRLYGHGRPAARTGRFSDLAAPLTSGISACECTDACTGQAAVRPGKAADGGGRRCAGRGGAAVPRVGRRRWASVRTPAANVLRVRVLIA